MTLNPLRPAFEYIHDTLYIHTPAEGEKNRKSSDPDTILFLAWGNAPRKNIIKYTNHYLQAYPGARIILFETPFSDLVLHTPERQAEPLSPAVKAIRAAGDGSKILVHLLSNGGSYKLRELAAAYKRTCGSVMPLDLLIIDSAPGLPDLARSIVAFQTQLPRFFIFYYIGTLIIYAYLLVNYIYHKTLGGSPITRQVWETLNDPELIDVKAKRLYMFSKTDELIYWKDVRLHAKAAKEKGYEVEEVEFTGSRHVAHVVVDKEKYWNCISSAWDSTLSGRAGG